ncbi:MAG: hypothetical protein KHZ99_09760 [Clostridium sp.]|uniref:hypothetical protein n=1 Tax=Clostridium sp. TaxID=1506 RepID=UPI0025BD3DCC|nr:hypothetical protein [Clostridium sp.]MBS4957318.1 hypothetical protein [Clostridium sp.]
MENKKLGGGILTISIIYLVLLGLGLIGSIISLVTLDEINSLMSQMGGVELTSTELIVSIILTLILLVGIILILLKKQIGVYTFFTVEIINIIYSLIMNGLSISILISTLVGLILPGLLAYFIYKKKELFGFESKEDNLDT